MKQEYNKYTLALEHKFNPLHVYCRMVDFGIDKKYARRIAKLYETHIYRKIHPIPED